jgi:predicted aminopeptidase
MRRSIILLAVVGLVVVGFASCSPTYVLRAGWEEARILAGRRPIQAALDDPRVSDELRGKLSLVREVRVFAERRLGLDAGSSYRSFTELSRDTLVMVVSAAPELELRWKTWWFPIVGHLPYKGFFDFEAARREAESLEAKGYDTYVRPSAAFSTLGWFPDPVLSPSLRGDSVSIAETVIHEITHTTWFPTGQARFNESFANFAGHVGAVEFFCDAHADPVPCELARERWHDVRVFGRFFHSIRIPLEELYASDVPDDTKRLRKREIIEAAAVRFGEDVIPKLRSTRYRGLDPATIDNAWLLGRLLYYTRLDDFETLYQHHGDLKRTVEAMRAAADDRDPWEALDELIVPAGNATSAEDAQAGADA